MPEKHNAKTKTNTRKGGVLIGVLAISFLALIQTLSVLGQGMLARGDEPRAPHSSSSYTAFEGSTCGAAIPPKLQEVLESSRSKKVGEYPTSFTKGIIPKPIHSHNDYWREVPYYSALSVGAISVEADIWLINGTLYVGHERSALTPERTFESLYVNPILDTLKQQNPTTAFVEGSSTLNGVFDTDSAQTLYLWIDCKTSGAPTFAAAIEALGPLHKAGYLTTYSTKIGTTYGPVTVIGTGDTPLAAVQGVSPRHYFWDAPLTELGEEAYKDITANVSPIASADFGASFPHIGWMGTRADGGIAVFSDDEKARLRRFINMAKERGIGSRFWGTPSWPVRTRHAVWRTVWAEGVALVNADDLADAAFGDWA